MSLDFVKSSENIRRKGETIIRPPVRSGALLCGLLPDVFIPGQNNLTADDEVPAACRKGGSLFTTVAR